MDSADVERLLKEMKDECDKEYAKMGDVNDLSERVEKLEGDYKEIDEKTKDNTDKITDNKTEIEELKKLLKDLEDKITDKVGCEQFDQEINYLKQLINSMGKDGGDGPPAPLIPTGPSLSTKDMNQLKDMFDKFPKLEDMINELWDKFKNLDPDSLLERLKQIEEKLDFHEKELLEKAQRSDMVQAQKDIKDLQDLIAQLKRAVADLQNVRPNSPGVKQDVIIQINNRIDKLEIKLDGMNREIG